MITRLDRLMLYLRPERCYDPWFRRAEEGLASFVFPPYPIDTWIRFADVFVLLYWHIEGFLLGLDKPLRLDASETWGHVQQVFQTPYGPSGYVTAYPTIALCVEGGRSAVALAFAHAIAEEQAKRIVRVAIASFWKLLSIDEQISLPDEFLASYGFLLPAETRAGSAARLRANFPTALEEVPRLYRRLEQRLPSP